MRPKTEAGTSDNIGNKTGPGRDYRESFWRDFTGQDFLGGVRSCDRDTSIFVGLGWDGSDD